VTARSWRERTLEAKKAETRRSTPLTYREHRPSSTVEPWVECYWSYATTVTDPPPVRVLPDGCADIIVEIGARPAPAVIGAMRQAIVAPMRGVDLFGIRFRPGHALPFIGVPLVEVTDARVDLDSVWTGWRRTLARQLGESLSGTPSEARPAVVDAVLTRCLIGQSRAVDLAGGGVSLIRQHRGRVTVRGLASALGVGERRLERTFATYVGLTPKELARVVRFGAVICRVQQDAGWRWSQLAWEAGYADQAHLVREFRALAGIAPTAYVAERRGVGFLQDGLDDEA
jgi:AraC-like DNA-binding protein